jgi:pimeloyl-ACP methyl ester carboxylesterase
MKPVLLVHGGMTGSWVWERLVPELKRQNRTVVTVDLPSKEPEGTLAADEATVRRALDEIGEPTVRVGHSYSGMVITGASTANSNVAHLVYVCAALPQENQSLSETMAPKPTDSVVPAPVINAEDHLADFRRDVCHDASDEEWASIRSRIGELARGVYTEIPSGLGWRKHPSTYVVATLDRSFPPDLQRRMAAHANETVEIEAAHMPMLTRPTELAALLGRISEL